MSRKWYTVILSLLLIGIAAGARGATVSTTSLGTIKDKSTSGGPDYGQWGHLYAPTVMKSGGNTDCWSCNGVATNGPGGGDHVLYMRNWGLEEVVLCPKLNNELTPISLCQNLYREGQQSEANRTGDHNGVCDPSVIKVGSTYYMYYTADPWDGHDNQMFLATSTDGRSWTKYPNNSVPATPVISFFTDWQVRHRRRQRRLQGRNLLSVLHGFSVFRERVQHDQARNVVKRREF